MKQTEPELGSPSCPFTKPCVCVFVCARAKDDSVAPEQGELRGCQEFLHLAPAETGGRSALLLLLPPVWSGGGDKLSFFAERMKGSRVKRDKWKEEQRRTREREREVEKGREAKTEGQVRLVILAGSIRL